jgi:hypothetical protein
MYIGVGLGGSNLEAKGGIVGGTIELSRIDTFSKFSHEIKTDLIIIFLHYNNQGITNK